MAGRSKKTNSLLDAVNRAVPPNGGKAEGRSVEPSASENGIGARSTGGRGARAGTKLIAGHFDPGVSRQLRLIAAEEDRTVQSLLEEALDLLFVKKGKAHIGDLMGR